jgi:hypothetical protein
MKQIIQLLTIYPSDPSLFEPIQIIKTVGKLDEHRNKAKAENIQREDEIHITWFTNTPTILPFIKHFLNEAALTDHVTLRAVDDIQTKDIDDWESDLRIEAKSLIPHAAIECLAPDTLNDLPILYYGLQAGESDLVELLGHEGWYVNYHKLLPSTHRNKALTWLYFLQTNADYDCEEVAVQDYLIKASALSLVLHGFESMTENHFFGYDSGYVKDALPLLDGAYIALLLDEEEKQQVWKVLEESEDQIVGAVKEALKLVSIQFSDGTLETIGAYLGNEASIFYTLWSSIWPDDALLQADRFTSILDTTDDRRLKLKAYEYVSALDFSLIGWD